MGYLLPRGILVELNIQPPFWTFTRVHSILGMVASRLGLNHILTQSLLGLFSRCKVFHLTTLRISIIILAVHNVVLLLNIATEFP